jgi:transcriptional regulator of acetoin/glycerol metabolism
VVLPVRDDVYKVVEGYSWPGNVRELANVCTYIAALSNADDKAVTLGKLPIVIASQSGTPKIESGANPQVKPAKKSNPSITRESLEQVIEQYGGHRENMAAHFGISRMTLWRKLKQFGLEQ